jgi:hypothetical protein
MQIRGKNNLDLFDEMSFWVGKKPRVAIQSGHFGGRCPEKDQLKFFWDRAVL